MTDWKKNNNKGFLYAAYRRLTSDAGHTDSKVKEWKKIFHANRNQKKFSVATLT